MGMKKISAPDEQKITRIIREWNHEKRLTWEELRLSIATQYGKGLNETWSRQALSANEAISTAFSIAKKRGRESVRPKAVTCTCSGNNCSEQMASLESELAELQSRYERLQLRHAQLAYNASLLEGGCRLLNLLPDNTQSQRG